MSASGWDYNLTKRCVKTTQPRLPNYYEETSGCSLPPIPGLPVKHWTLAIQSERELGVSCPEPEDQSFLINGPSSPVTLAWLQHTDEFGNSNWSINMKTNLHDFTHSCGENHFNWYMFMDHVAEGGGPLPVPDALRFSATVNYNDFCPHGAARALAMFQGYWNGKQRMIELHFQSTNWGDAEPDNPIIVSRFENANFQYLALHGQYFNIQIPKQQDTALNVSWNDIIAALIGNGDLPAPSGEWSTQAVGIGHEAHNWTPTLAVIADLWFTNFRVVSVT